MAGRAAARTGAPSALGTGTPRALARLLHEPLALLLPVGQGHGGGLEARLRRHKHLPLRALWALLALQGGHARRSVEPRRRGRHLAWRESCVRPAQTKHGKTKRRAYN